MEKNNIKLGSKKRGIDKGGKTIWTMDNTLIENMGIEDSKILILNPLDI